MNDRQAIVVMIRNLADNVEAGHLAVTGFTANELSESVAEVQFVLKGEPMIIPDWDERD